MKKKTLDKQLIKALAIGISASMALQPVTALAAEGEEGTNAEQESIVNTPGEGSATEAAGNTETSESVAEIKDKIENIENAESEAKAEVSNIANEQFELATKGDAEGNKKDPIQATEDALTNAGLYADDVNKEIANASTDAEKEAAEAKKSVVENALNDGVLVETSAEEFGQAREACEETAKASVVDANDGRESIVEEATTAKNLIGDAADAVWPSVLSDVVSSNPDSDAVNFINSEFLKHVDIVDGKVVLKKDEGAVEATLAVKKAVEEYIASEDTTEENKNIAKAALAKMERVTALSEVYSAAEQGEADIKAKTDDLNKLAENAMNTIGDDADSSLNSWFANYGSASKATTAVEKTTEEKVKDAIRNTKVKNAEADAAVYVKEYTDEIYANAKAEVEVGTKTPDAAAEEAYGLIEAYVNKKKEALSDAETKVTTAKTNLDVAVLTGDKEIIATAQEAYDNAVTAKEIAAAEKTIADKALNEAGKVKTISGVFKAASDVVTAVSDAYTNVMNVVKGYRDAFVSGKKANDPIGDAADTTWKDTEKWLEAEYLNANNSAEKQQVLTEIITEVKPIIDAANNGEKNPVVAEQEAQAVIAKYSANVNEADIKNTLSTLQTKVAGIKAVSDVYALANANNTDTKVHQAYLTMLSDAVSLAKNIGDHCDKFIDSVFGWTDAIVNATKKNAADAEKKQGLLQSLLAAEKAEEAKKSQQNPVTDNRNVVDQTNTQETSGQDDSEQQSEGAPVAATQGTTSTRVLQTAPIASAATNVVTNEVANNRVTRRNAVAANNAVNNTVVVNDNAAGGDDNSTQEAVAEVVADIADSQVATVATPEVTTNIVDEATAKIATPETGKKGIPGVLVAVLGTAVAAAGVSVEELIRRGKIKIK